MDQSLSILTKNRIRELERNNCPIFGQDFCLSSVGWPQAHSKLRNCCYLAEGGQKDQQDWMIIFSHLPKLYFSIKTAACTAIPSLRPSKPSFSVVVAFTLMQSISTTKSLAIFVHIATI